MKGYGGNPVADPIAWELERLDRELNPASLLETLTSSCPLAIPALGLIAGLIVQQCLSLPPAVWLLIAFLTALKIGTVTLFRQKLVTVPIFGGVLNRSGVRFYLAGFCCFSLCLSLGALRLTAFRTPPPDDLSRWVTSDRTLATLRGTLASEIQRENRDDWTFGRWQWTEPGSSFLIAVDEVQTLSGWQKASGRLFVHVNGPVKNIPPHSRLQIYCRLNRLEPPPNPGQFNFKQYMENQGVRLSASVPAACSMEVLQTEDDQMALPSALRLRLRLWAQESLEAWGGDQRLFSSLPEALLLGSRGRLDAQIYGAFQRTGLAHYISLSGMHVGILASFCWWMGRALGLLKRPRAILCILLITLYALIVPPRAPTLRAVFLAEFFFLSILLTRRPNSLNTLALTAIVLLLNRPTDLFSPGWQLSYSTVLGILLLTARLQRKFSSLLFYLHPPLHKYLSAPYAEGILTLTRSFLDVLSVGLGAWLGGAGVMLWHFGSVTPLSALWTLLVFPLVLLILILGTAKLLLAHLMPSLALILSVLVDRISDLFAAVTVWIADLNLLSFQIGKVSLLLIGLYYVWLFCAFFARRLPGRRPFLFGFGGCLLIYPFVQTAVLPRFRGELELTFLSVGHGLAVVAKCPDGQTLLLDGGSISVKDPGGRVILPFLRYKGIRRLDALIVSHGDLDHYNGLPEILDSMPTQTVCLYSGFPQKAKTSSAAARMKELAMAKNGMLLESGDFIWNHKEIRISSLWPDAEALRQADLSENDKSEVLLLEYAGRRILLCGDIERYAQERLLSKYPRLRADVLLLPHHGSGNNVMPHFVEKLNPSVRVISCAERRLGGILPSGPEDESWITAAHGAVTVKIKADGTIRTVGFLNSNH